MAELSNKSKYFLGAGVLIVAAAALVLRQKSTSPDTSLPQTLSGQTTPAALSPEEGGLVVNPVSLPAFMQHSYDGRDLKLGRVLDDNASYTRYYITYKSGDLNISGIMNIPKGTPPEGGFPVLLLNHGHIDTSVYTNGRGLKREQDYLARHGYAVLHSDYRNHADSDKDPDADIRFRLGYVEDVINAAYAVKNSDLASLNKDKIGMLGHSMGGGVTINTLVVQPDLIKAAVLFAPVSADQRDNFHRWLERRPEIAQKIIELFGRPEDNPDFWDDISAQTFFDKINAPILLHHGTADESVPIEWSDRLVKQLKGKNKTIDYRVYPGQPHEFTSAWPEVMQTSLEFFDSKLR
jgi:uncharacterized protein